MQTIKRDIYVTKNVLQAPIEVTEGTNSIALEFLKMKHCSLML